MKKLMSILVVMVLVAAALVLTDTIPLTVKGENVHETFTAFVKGQQYVESFQAGAKRLMNELWTAVDENDVDRFTDLFCHGDEPENRAVYEEGLASWRDFRKQTKGWSLKSDLTQVNDTQGYGEWVYYAISGNERDNDRDSMYFALGFELVDHSWRLAEDATDIVKALIKTIDVKYWDALENDRKAYMCEPLMMPKTGFCYPGIYSDSVSYAYLNEDGSMDILLQFRNGTSKFRSVDSTKVQIKDENGKVLLSYTLKDKIVNPAHTSTDYTLHIDASKIKNVKWTDYIETHVNTSY